MGGYYGDHGEYTGGNTEDTLTGAMKQWYSEKSIYDNAIKTGEFNGKKVDSAFLEANRHNGYNVYQKYMDLYESTGHYLNFMDANVSSVGFAANTTNGVSYGGEIVWRGSAGYGSMTVDQFKALASKYLGKSTGSAVDTTELQNKANEAKKNYDDVRKAADAADAAYKAAVNDTQLATKAVTEAMTAKTTADNNLKAAQQKLADLKNAASNLEAAQKAYDQAVSTVNALQKLADNANADLTMAKVNQKVADDKLTVADAALP